LPDDVPLALVASKFVCPQCHQEGAYVLPSWEAPSCGDCFFCRNGFYSGCERTNPDREDAAKLWGNAPAGLFGYSHLLGGYAGGQAEYLRVPYADVGPIKIPSGLSDEQVLFLSDIFPTGYMVADFCALKGGETVAVWGCGPVGQFAIRSALLLGAKRVLAIDAERQSAKLRH
jgi:threonine dehydrogenase-like Zn-dependent dehydrogenase